MTDCAVILMHLQNIVFMLFKLNDGLAFVTIFPDHLCFICFTPELFHIFTKYFFKLYFFLQMQTNPIMIRVDTKAGHGSGKPTAKIVRMQMILSKENFLKSFINTCTLFYKRINLN